MNERYGDEFKAEMGAEAVKKLLKEIDLEELSASLKKELEESVGQKRIKLLKRLEVVESFRLSGNGYTPDGSARRRKICDIPPQRSLQKSNKQK